MININEIREKSNEWIEEHVEKFNMLLEHSNNESKINFLSAINVLENELELRKYRM